MAAIMRAAAGVSWTFLRPAWGSARDGGRRGARALRRRPVRVLPSLAQAQEEQQQTRPPPPPLQQQPRRADEAGKARRQGAEPDEQQPRRADEAGKARRQGAEPDERLARLSYDRASPGDRRLSKMVTLAKSRAFREKHGKILLEGRRLITDALSAGAEPQTVFFSNLNHLKELPMERLKGVALIKVKFEDLKAWSDVVAPQGVIGIFSRPDHTKMTYPEVPLQHALPLSLICDNIRDPGNLGTILRSAAGAGCTQVLLTKGCVDVWEPKVLRAGMGAHFRIPVVSNLEWDAVPDHLPPETNVHVADSSQTTVPVNIGSHGWVSRPSDLKKRPAEMDTDSDLDLDSENQAPGLLELQHYTEFWMDPPVAVVIGGETHGVSPEAKQLADETGGKRLLIPVVPGVDSLNSAMAASILVFEGKRQIAEDTTVHHKSKGLMRAEDVK